MIADGHIQQLKGSGVYPNNFVFPQPNEVFVGFVPIFMIKRLSAGLDDEELMLLSEFCGWYVRTYLSAPGMMSGWMARGVDTIIFDKGDLGWKFTRMSWGQMAEGLPAREVSLSDLLKSHFNYVSKLSA